MTDNGLRSEGAGILFANATAGTASYDNLVEGNFIAGNGIWLSKVVSASGLRTNSFTGVGTRILRV